MSTGNINNSSSVADIPQENNIKSKDTEIAELNSKIETKDTEISQLNNTIKEKETELMSV